MAPNGFCPEWIVENIDRYWTPLLEHVYLTVVPVAIGFLDLDGASRSSPTAAAG